MNEIWVPCHYNVETFAGSGVLRQKLRVVPGGVDANVFHPAAPPLEPKQKDFVFLSVFGWFDHKGWDLLLTAYCTEFKPEEDVVLADRDSSITCITPLQLRNRSATLSILCEYRRRQSLSCESSTAVWPAVRCPVSIPAATPLSCRPAARPGDAPTWKPWPVGLPVIGSRWSGNLEFMNDENSYLIDIEGLEDVRGNVDMQIYLGHKWARPSLEHLRYLMRHVFEHRQEARAKGTRARQDVCQKWTWGHAAATECVNWQNSAEMPRSRLDGQELVEILQTLSSAAYDGRRRFAIGLHF